MNRSESKYFNTAIRMDEALITLLDKKDFSYITVKEICQVAEVNRSTFYLHYESTADLLEETLEYIDKKFLDCFPTQEMTIVSRISEASPEELVLITEDYLRPYLTFIRDNRKIFMAAVNQKSIYGSAAKYEKMNTYIFDPILERFGVPREERSYMMAFYIQGIMGILTKWIQDGCKRDIAEISQLVIRMVVPKDKGDIGR